MMGMHPDQNPDRLVDELIRIHAPWVEYNSARKRRRHLLRVVAKAVIRILRDATAVRTSLGSAPRLGPELFLKLSVPMYLIMIYAWVTASTD